MPRPEPSFPIRFELFKPTRFSKEESVMYFAHECSPTKKPCTTTINQPPCRLSPPFHRQPPPRLRRKSIKLPRRTPYLHRRPPQPQF